MTNFFAKSFSNLFRIPESKYLKRSPTWDVYEFLLDMVYRKEVGFYGTNDHVRSAKMAKHYKDGKIGTFTTVLEIEKYRDLSKNAVKDGLRELVQLGFIKLPEGTDPQTPWDNGGMFYQVGYRTRNAKGTYSGEKSYLEEIDAKLKYEDEAIKFQKVLIDMFANAREKAKGPATIYNLRFGDGIAKKMKETPKRKAKVEEVEEVETQPVLTINERLSDYMYDMAYVGYSQLEIETACKDLRYEIGLDAMQEVYDVVTSMETSKLAEDILDLGSIWNFLMNVARPYMHQQAAD
ncbi:hypothetical protein [Deinococcus ficus]|uniref:hypothetical protein n=1 Tax=Deinococcus ficus TaxID=317577 RepID=UPI0003FFF06F|nr:hypothetical protein [Deinococcus ficus]